MQYGINKQLVKTEQAVSMEGNSTQTAHFPAFVFGRALDTSAIIK